MTLPTISLLIINPNSTTSMTDTLKPLIQSLAYPNTTYTYLTAPTGPPSINNQHDLDLSTTHTLPHLLPLLATHDGFLVACYSTHPLVAALKRRTRKPVLGIFEASVAASLLLLDSDSDASSSARSETGEEDEGEGEEGEEVTKGKGNESEGGEGKGKFGIVSTGAAWEELLSRGVRDLVGGESGRFAGVETTGLSAVELHERPQEEVWGRVREAAGRLVSGGEVRVVCLGCAGMVGMEAVVREGVRVVLGDEGRVRVVDGVKAGVGMLVTMVRGGF